MNLDYLKGELARFGWKNIHTGNYMGIQFDLIGSRYFTLTRWHFCVKVLPLLDRNTLNSWQEIFEKLSRESKSSIWWGKCFLLCLIVRDISLDVIQSFYDDDFGLFGAIRLKGGGGKILVASLSSKQVYGQVPSLPYDVRKYTRDAIGLLKNTLEVSKPSELAAVVSTAADASEAQKAQPSGRYTVFISYSRKDEQEKDHLVTHLRVLERVGLIELWSDDRISSGTGWEEEITCAISRAQVAILLVSANSLTSDYILNNEIPAIIERQEREKLVVLPVIAKPCVWKRVDWLSRINVLPRDGKPIWGSNDRQPDIALALVAEEVAAVVRNADVI